MVKQALWGAAMLALSYLVARGMIVPALIKEQERRLRRRLRRLQPPRSTRSLGAAETAQHSNLAGISNTHSSWLATEF